MKNLKSFIKDVISGTSTDSVPVNENESVNASVNANDDDNDNANESASANEGAGENTKAEKQNVYNLIIVDESGSMGHLRDATLSGINELIGTIREAQKEFADKQNHYLTLVTFDERSGSKTPSVRTLYDAVPIAMVPENFDKYKPYGCTPLYDAMGQSLTALHNKIGDDSRNIVSVTILTDGLENASREWRPDSLRRLIEQLKELGWAFSYMGSAHDVKEVTDLLSIDNVMEWSHDQMGATNTWRRERASKRAFFEGASHLNMCCMSDEDIVQSKRRMSKEYYGHRVTPDYVTELKDNEIFVFGSNPEGQHNGGAAKVAQERFGAVMGQGEGLQGKSYAIPTTGGILLLRDAVQRFTDFALTNPDKRFLVTRIGCGNAGYPLEEVARMFRDCVPLENVALPAEFWRALGIRNFNM